MYFYIAINNWVSGWKNLDALLTFECMIGEVLLFQKLGLIIAKHDEIYLNRFHL